MRTILLLLLVLSFSACKKNEKTTPPGLPTEHEVEKAIFKVNKYILKRNRDHITGFLRRTGWDMQQSGSGLWYRVKQEGSGKTASNGDYIKLKYELRLIDGSLISSSKSDGLLEFTVGQGGVESGLEEAVLMLGTGARATLIVPPHLAYGNFGDNELGIPPDAILLYELEVVGIDQNN
jgi:FKBP-type peptidyl-prolyl cis-trans isomerase